MIKRVIFFLTLLAVPLLVAAVTFWALNRAFVEPVDPSKTETTLFQIESQESFKAISKDLENKGLIKHAWAFTLIAKLKGRDKSIMAGEYELTPAMTPEEILEKLVSGKMFLRKVTIKEGTTIWELPKAIDAAGILSQAEFEGILTDPNLLRELKIPALSFEGYLFPETYQFPKNTPAKTIISKMVDELQANWKPEFDAKARELNMTKHQILTLASIVEKESGNFDEQPLIASVFHNRLKQNMRLQADPTVIYGIPNFNGNLTKEDLLTPTPYNTYVIDGLPPGPIGNPGIKAIEAALFPKDTNYFYFVADGKGHHIFTADLSEHNKAVDQFQKSQKAGATDGAPAKPEQ